MAAKSSGSSEKTTRRTTTTRRRRTAAAEPASDVQHDVAEPAAAAAEPASDVQHDVPEPAAAAEPQEHRAEEREVREEPAAESHRRTADEPRDEPQDFGAGLYEEPRRDEAREGGEPERRGVVRDNGEGDYGGQPGRRRRRRRRRRGGAGEMPERAPREPQGRRRYGHQRDDYRHRQRTPQPQRARSYADEGGGEVTGVIEGVLELHPKGYGFLRDPQKNYAAQESDAFVSSTTIEKHRLREGVLIRGEVGPGTKGQGPRLKGIETIDGRTPDEYLKIKSFDELTAINPFEQIKLERGPRPITMRVMDLLTPIGKGQRALIVAPPRTGKTMLLQDIADSVSHNHPEVQLMVLLIDERPEEVTEMRRRVRGEVIASSMDREVESHVRISQLIFERAKRLAEAGGDVFILLDSVTRTARAFNKWIGNTGRTMSGGLDVKAMDIPKKMFGTARRFDEGGSLTVAATALIDTGSRMDEVIFQEFKGTGNMELVLSRDLADRRIWPAIDITLSGTRREEKIVPPDVLEGITMLRRSLISLNPVEAMEQLTRILEKYPSNAEFLTKVRQIL